MGLSVIGAGFGRTGTASMKAALELLGLGPCHHMKELTTLEQNNYWMAAAEGQTMAWDKVFEGYGSSVDWPAAFFWRELSEYYPDAKILLTVRDPEDWYKSMQNTIFNVLKAKPKPFAVAVKLVGERLFEERYDDNAFVMGLYEQNILEVQAAIPSDRLLTYELGSGWGPLCRFLGKPIPDAEFPRSNSTQEFQSDIQEKIKGE